MKSIEEFHRTVRDVRVFGTPSEIETLIAIVERMLDHDWFREHEAEERFRRRTGCAQYIFIRARKGERPGVAIELRATRFGLTVHKLVPERYQLSLEDHNEILVDFFLRYIDPVSLELELLTEISSDEICIKHGRRHTELIVPC
jgi:hypothetical protein